MVSMCNTDTGTLRSLITRRITTTVVRQSRTTPLLRNIMCIMISGVITKASAVYGIWVGANGRSGAFGNTLAIGNS